MGVWHSVPMNACVRRVVAICGGVVAGGSLASGYETLSGGNSQMALTFLGLGLGVGLMLAALVRE